MPRDTFEKSASLVSDGEGLAGRRRSGIHQQRARAAIGFQLGPHALQFEEMPIEIEVVARRRAS
jgi:hypothetical protein